MGAECACWACELLTEYAHSFRPPPPEVLLAACCRKLRNQEATQPMWPREHDASEWRTANWDAASSAANAAKKAGLGSVKPALMRRDTRLHLDGDVDQRSEYFSSYVMPQGVLPRPPLAKRRTELRLEGDILHIPEYVDSYKPHPSWGKPKTVASSHSNLRDQDLTFKDDDNNEVPQPLKDLFQCSTDFTVRDTAFPHIRKRSQSRPMSALRDDAWWYSNVAVPDIGLEEKKHLSEYMDCFGEIPNETFKEICQERQWSKIHNSSTTIVNGNEHKPYHPPSGCDDELGSTINFSTEYKDKFKGLPPLEKREQSRPRTALRELDWKVKHIDPVSDSEWKSRRWVGSVRVEARGKESSGYNTPVPPTQRRSRLDTWEAAQVANKPVNFKDNSRTTIREGSMTRLERRLSSTFSKTRNTANEQPKRPPFRLVVNNLETRDRIRGRSVSPSRLRWQINAERKNNAFVVLERTP